MKFIKRIPITAGMISGEQAQQTDLWYTNEAGALVAVAPWVSGQNVSTGDRRSHDQKVWQALSTHASTAEPDTAPTLWAFVAPTNRWAAFDDAVGSAIQETGSLSFTLTPGQRFDSFGVLGMAGSQLGVDLRVAGTNTLLPYTLEELPSSELVWKVEKKTGVTVAVSPTLNKAYYKLSTGGWVEISFISSFAILDLRIANGVFFIFGGSTATFYTSTTGSSFTQRTFPSSVDAYTVQFFNSRYYVFAQSTTSYFSTIDFSSFLTHTFPVQLSTYPVVSANAKMTTILFDSAYNTTDGVNWTQSQLPFSGGWKSLDFGGGKYFGVGQFVNGQYVNNIGIKSSNGVDWFSVTLPAVGLWLDVKFLTDSFFITTTITAITEVNLYKTENLVSFIELDAPLTQHPYLSVFDESILVSSSSSIISYPYGESIYKTTIPLIQDEEPVIDFWTYCFAGFKQKEDLIVTGLNSASYTNASINITINGATTSDPVKLGTFNFGMVQVLGITEMGMKTSITNYSTYDVDSFGVTRITPRSFAKKINANVAVEREKYNTVYRALIEVKDTAVIVFPSDSDDYSEATTYGHIREWSLSIDYPTYTMLPIEVRGLT